MNCAMNRRMFLTRTGMGFGLMALGSVLDRTAVASEINPLNPLAARPGHFPGKAKHVIHIFANGGPSHVDTFDPKPSLLKYAGKALPMENLATERKTGAAFPSPFKF